MKTILTTVVFLVLIMTLNGQQSFSEFIDSANHISNFEDRIMYIESYVAHLDTAGAPVIEDDTANFVYNGSATSVEIAGDFNGWGGDGTWTCNKIDGTDFFWYSHTFESTARLDYKFIINGSNWILDPLNPFTVSGGYGPNSELAMPAYVQPWEIHEYPGVEKGTIESFSIKSPELNKNFSVQVYLPPGYDASGFSYPVVYVHDGQEYLSLGGMDHVMDNLLDSNKIDPLIGVFIRPNNRNEEYGFSQRYQYAQFIAETMVPYVDSAFRTIASKDFRLTMGTSLGGNISGLISYTYHGLFANSGWHSPAFWVNDLEVANLYTSGYKDIKIYFTEGTYEDLGVDWAGFTDDLTQTGYLYNWAEYHEGHSWGHWRATIDDILKYFFPVGNAPLALSDFRYQESETIRLFPNPVIDNAALVFIISQSGKYTLHVYNQLGQIIKTESYFLSGPSSATIEFDGSELESGAYYFSISGMNKYFSGKMLKH